LAVAELTVRINSPAGSVFDGAAMYNALKRHDAAITVWIDGIAASIARIIAIAGDEVVMPENAMLMLHDPSGLVIGPPQTPAPLDWSALMKLTGSITRSLQADMQPELCGIERWLAELPALIEQQLEVD
jgi:ATP-dependent protease ClpP protease subunit